jgi:hypothetical protein
MSGRKALGIVAAAATGVAAYATWVRPRQLTWGTTPEEVERPLPGDDLVARPTFNATRAISIKAPQEHVWSWLVQVGLGRAGWYSYDLLDNLGRRSSGRIIPELQHLAPGDIVPMGPGAGQGIPVHALDPPRTMIWGRRGDSSWVWQLDPCADGSTRLITRIRSRIRPTPTSIFFNVLFEVADFWMLRKMLLNLRERAESHMDLRATTGPGPRRVG